MGAAVVADSLVRPVNYSAWAVGRALEFAAATALFALVTATLISGAGAERFASVAYVAMIVAALLLVIKWFLPAAPSTVRPPGTRFPAILSFLIVVALFVTGAAAFVAQPSDAVIVIVSCFALIGGAALVRAGFILRVNAALRRGRPLSAAVRYAVAAAIAALTVCALFSAQRPDALAKVAYAAIVFATGALVAQQLAHTRAGTWTREAYARTVRQFRSATSAVIFARAAEYAVATLVAGLVLAMLLPSTLAERFATTAYVAALFTAAAVIINWRRRNVLVPDDRWTHRTGRQRLRFAALVAAFLVVGSALAFSPVAEALGAAACLYAIAAAIAKRTRTPVQA